MIISRSVFLRMRNVSLKFIEKFKPHILCSMTFFRKSRIKHGTSGQSTDDNIIRRMRNVCWITKATDTHSESVNTYCFCTATVVTLRRLNVTFVLCLSFRVLFLTINGLIISLHSASCSVRITETKCVYCAVRTESLSIFTVSKVLKAYILRTWLIVSCFISRNDAVLPSCWGVALQFNTNL